MFIDKTILKKYERLGTASVLALALSISTGVGVGAQDATPAAPVTAAAATDDAGAAAPASGSCYVAPAKLPDDKIKAFMDNPDDLLSDHPAGGVSLSNVVRALAGSEISSVDALLRVASTAGPTQQAAIGAGLARAARACVVNRPDLAEALQQKIALSENQPLITAFLAGSGNVETAAIGIGPGGGNRPAIPAAGLGGNDAGLKTEYVETDGTNSPEGEVFESVYSRNCCLTSRSTLRDIRSPTN